MDPWQMFAFMCKTVVENGNVGLEVVLTNGMIQMHLIPVSFDYEDEDE